MFDKVEYVICVHVHAPTPPLAQCQLSPGWRWAPKPPSLIPPPANRPNCLTGIVSRSISLESCTRHKAGNCPTCSSKALQEVDSLGLSPLIELGGALWCRQVPKTGLLPRIRLACAPPTTLCLLSPPIISHNTTTSTTIANHYHHHISPSPLSPSRSATLSLGCRLTSLHNKWIVMKRRLTHMNLSVKSAVK